MPRTSTYFQYDWRSVGGWNLAFVGGVVLGGVAHVDGLPVHAIPGINKIQNDLRI